MTGLIWYQCFVQDLGRKVHDLDTDVLKVAFTNRAPVPATDKVFSDVVEIAAGNGYTAGGYVLAATSWAEAGGVVLMPGTDISIVSSTGPFGPFQYFALYNSTAAAKNLIGYWDRGAPLTLDGTISEPLTLHFAAPTQVIALETE